jgi:hypothetical protein
MSKKFWPFATETAYNFDYSRLYHWALVLGIAMFLILQILVLLQLGFI